MQYLTTFRRWKKLAYWTKWAIINSVGQFLNSYHLDPGHNILFLLPTFALTQICIRWEKMENPTATDHGIITGRPQYFKHLFCFLFGTSEYFHLRAVYRSKTQNGWKLNFLCRNRRKRKWKRKTSTLTQSQLIKDLSYIGKNLFIFSHVSNLITEWQLLYLQAPFIL